MRTLLASISFDLLLAASLFAADKPKDNQAPKFTAKTELVLVHVTVTGKKGEAVHGLTAQDFIVTEKGKEQAIKTFEEVTTTGERTSYAPTAAAKEFTNRITQPGQASHLPRLTIIAFDMLNTPPLRQALARQALLEVLAKAADSTEPTALYTLGQRGVKVITDFTTDPKVLGEALKKLKFAHPIAEDRGIGAGPHENPSTSTPTDQDYATTGRINYTAGVTSEDVLAKQLEEMLTEVQLNMTSMERRFAAIYTLDGMQQIAQACAAVPGRKSLLWVTGGFPFDVSPTDMNLLPGSGTPYAAGRSTWEDVFPLYLRTWRALGDAQIAVYPIDVRGITNPDLVSPAYNAAGRVGVAMQRYQNQQIIETDNAMADATGGKAFYNSNGLKEGFEEALKDSASYYVVGYYLTPDAKTKAGWHPLSVKSRNGGVHVRARSGYFYNSNTEDLQKTRQSNLATALYSPIDLTAIGLTAKWKQVTAGQNGVKHVNFELVMPADFAEVDQADKNHLLLDFVAVAKSREGKMVGNPISRTIDAHLDDTQIEQIRQRGFTYANSLDLPAGQYAVRFVIRDGLNGHTGTVTAPLTVTP